MPNPKYTGSPTGEGNPPGKYSKGYTAPMATGGHFVGDAGYKNYGGADAPLKASEVGNQPKKESTKAVGLHEGGIPYK